MERTIKRGEVYWIDFDPPYGTRPALVIQNNIGNKFAPSVIVVAITAAVVAKSYPTDVLLPDGLLPKENSRVLAGDVLTVKKARVGDYITALPDDVMEEVNLALITSLDLEKYRTT